MPIYEYKCPNGHLLEVFHGMNEPGPTKCEVCGASPLERVLYPVAVHYKGSGFYSTDYGRGRRSGKESGSDSSGGGDSGGGELRRRWLELRRRRLVQLRLELRRRLVLLVDVLVVRVAEYLLQRVPDAASRPERRRRRLRRREAGPHGEDAAVVLGREQDGGTTDARRVAPEPAVEGV